jgi:hypothetical protein
MEFKNFTDGSNHFWHFNCTFPTRGDAYAFMETLDSPWYRENLIWRIRPVE